MTVLFLDQYVSMVDVLYLEVRQGFIDPSDVKSELVVGGDFRSVRPEHPSKRFSREAAVLR